MSEDVVVVNKPASVPVHPAGTFRVSLNNIGRCAALFGFAIASIPL